MSVLVRHLVLALAALAPIPAVALTASPAGAALGDPLAGSLEHDFFQYFGFREASRGPASPGETAVVFGQAEGAMFGKVVSLVFTVDAKGQLVAGELALARSFVDGPQGVFARDVAKSFLAFATPAADAAAVADLARAIGAFGEQGAAAPSPGYRAFLGTAPRFEQQLPTSALRLETVKRGAEPWLVLALRLGGPGAPPAAPPLDAPAWHRLFLDAPYLRGLELTQDSRDAGADPDDAAFAAAGGQRQGFAVWMSPKVEADLWRVVDVRLVFGTEAGAARYLEASWAALSEGAKEVAGVAPVVPGARVFGGTTVEPLLGGTMTQYFVVFRVGRVVVKLYAAQGPDEHAKALTVATMSRVAKSAAARARQL